MIGHYLPTISNATGEGTGDPALAIAVAIEPRRPVV